jgi:signal transduction histidine kinase
VFSSLPQSLGFRIALLFLLFVVGGSLALFGWLEYWANQDRRRAFERLAETNSAFIRQQRIPLTERTEEALGRVLGMRVRFRWAESASALEERARRVPGRTVVGVGEEAVAAGVGEGVDLVLVRPLAGDGRETRTVWVLAAFWVVSAATAWAVSRGVVLPLRQLVQRLPKIEADRDQAVPGADRRDEIGELARAYRATRNQLAEERTLRERAERMAILGRMATGLAHEIHNPLAAMRMHTELIQSAGSGHWREVLEESVPILLAENRRIEGLVNQWMFLARPEPPRCVLGDFGELLKEQVALHAAAARHAGVEMEREAEGRYPVAMDPRRIGQAIGNVLVNAVQAMSGGGRLRIVLRRESGQVVARFDDSGPGFSRTALERHAELFYSEKEGGMGVGLNVTAEILAAHGGTLRVRNRDEGGARVEMWLPEGTI